MIPVRLRLRNFMSYGEGVPALDFGGIHLACLCGDNGHGKSALLDAITWSLWGRARISGRGGSSDDELIHLGRTEMEVEFEFELDGHRYLALRKRAIRSSGKRRVGSTILEFQISDGEGWRALTGDSVSATERKIVEMLRLDYETFVNSAFILQGRADEFSRKTASERKRILSDLLGLTYYDALEERARERARKFEVERREQIAIIEEIDRDLAREPGYVRELERLNGVVDGLAAEIERQNGHVARLQSARQELETKAAQRAETQARVARTEAGLRGLQAQIAQAEVRIREREGIVAQAEAIRAGVAGLAAARAEAADLDERFARLHELTGQRTAAEARVAKARAEIDAARQLRANEVARYRRDLLREPALRTQEAELKAELATLVPLAAEREELGAQIEEALPRVEVLKTANVRIREEGQSIRERLDLLKIADAKCPICEGDLDAAGRERLRSRYEADRRKLLDDFRQNESEVKALDARATQARSRLEAIESHLRHGQESDRKLAAVERSLADLVAQREALTTAVAEEEKLVARLEAGDYARADQAELARAVAAIAALAYDAERHQRARSRRESLARYEGLIARLEEAEGALPSERANLGGLRDLAETTLASTQGDRQALALLDRDLLGRPIVERDLAAAKRALDEAIRRHAEGREARGEVQQRLNHCQYQRQERERRDAVRLSAAREKELHDELALAFGKKGIQAMVIENVIPEIELESNAILARMTDGRLNVKFETQRDARSGDGVIETLDIRISDELGVRNLELYSGGEAFRVNFAVRIALSKLLARRAGARVQTLVIDEGFGTQDAFGRQRLIEAINSVIDDFAKIIVITHIEELKDAFPTRIDVVKGPDGSRLTVT